MTHAPDFPRLLLCGLIAAVGTFTAPGVRTALADNATVVDPFESAMWPPQSEPAAAPRQQRVRNFGIQLTGDGQAGDAHQEPETTGQAIGADDAQIDERQGSIADFLLDR